MIGDLFLNFPVFIFFLGSFIGVSTTDLKNLDLDFKKSSIACEEPPIVVKGKGGSEDEKSKSPSLKTNCSSSPFVELRSAYFLPIGDPFRKIYSGGPLVGLEGDFPMARDWGAWGAVDYFGKYGKTTKEQSLTHLSLVPLSIGFKWRYHRYKVQPYFGAGLMITYLHESTKDFTLARVEKLWNCGGILKTGLFIYFQDQFFLDLYSNYLLSKTSLSHSSFFSSHINLVHSADLSGFSFGAGLGYEF